jgi:hypothetical protein
VPLSDIQLLALDTLIYVMGDESARGQTIGQVLDSLTMDNLNMSAADFQRLKGYVAAAPALSRLEVVDLYPRHDSNSNMAFLEDPVDGGQYAIFAGTASDEWDNDATNADSAWQPNKEAMQRWFDRQPVKVPPGCVVSGHSDGGNDAMYLAIKDGVKVASCLAFNGEGFSDRFVRANHQAIAVAQAKITCINCDNDPVSAMENPVGGLTSFVAETIDTGNLNSRSPLFAGLMAPLLRTSLTYAIKCHSISSLYARDAAGNLEFALAEASPKRSPILDPITGFTTRFLEAHIPKVELAAVGAAVDGFTAGGLKGKILGVGLLLSQTPGLLLQIASYASGKLLAGVRKLFFDDPDKPGSATRDFTPAAEQRLLEVAGAAQRKWSGATDAAFDLVERASKWPVVKNCCGHSEAYWYALLDSQDISVAALQRLLRDVHTVDHIYAGRFMAYRKRLTAAARALEDVMNSL